jgi:hypothetical protein
MNLPHARQMVAQRTFQGLGQHGHPVLEPLPVPNRDLSGGKVQVLHTKPQTFPACAAGAAGRQ